MISKEEVKHIAQLARLGISQEEEKALQNDLSSILDYFSLLQKVKTDNVEPLFHPGNNMVEVSADILRKDKAEERDEELTKKIRKNFPEEEKGYLKVKAIL